ncbi:MAG: hypothetical protein Q9M31_06070 [Mariprofundus sp.]|nr:hypothetical protein [Mariprofundus sp.]
MKLKRLLAAIFVVAFVFSFSLIDTGVSLNVASAVADSDKDKADKDKKDKKDKADKNKADKVKVCHVSAGHPDGKTKEIKSSDLTSYLEDHSGDYAGKCAEAPKPPEVPEETPPVVITPPDDVTPPAPAPGPSCICPPGVASCVCADGTTGGNGGAAIPEPGKMRQVFGL